MKSFLFRIFLTSAALVLIGCAISGSTRDKHPEPMWSARAKRPRATPRQRNSASSTCLPGLIFRDTPASFRSCRVKAISSRGPTRMSLICTARLGRMTSRFR